MNFEIKNELSLLVLKWILQKRERNFKWRVCKVQILFSTDAIFQYQVNKPFSAFKLSGPRELKWKSLSHCEQKSYLKGAGLLRCVGSTFTLFARQANLNVTLRLLVSEMLRSQMTLLRFFHFWFFLYFCLLPPSLLRDGKLQHGAICLCRVDLTKLQIIWEFGQEGPDQKSNLKLETNSTCWTYTPLKHLDSLIKSAWGQPKVSLSRGLRGATDAAFTSLWESRTFLVRIVKSQKIMSTNKKSVTPTQAET